MIKQYIKPSKYPIKVSILAAILTTSELTSPKVVYSSSVKKSNISKKETHHKASTPTPSTPSKSIASSTHYGISSDAFAKKKVSKAEIRYTLNKAFDVFPKNSKSFTKRDTSGMIDVLYFANNSDYFKLDYKTVIAQCAHESHMHKYSRNLNRDGSVDFGIGQNNSRYIDSRFISAINLNKKMHITSTELTTDKYDPVTGLIATIVYMKDNREYLHRYGVFYKRHIPEQKWIISYNSGASGAANNIDYPAYRLPYYKKVQEERNKIK